MVHFHCFFPHPLPKGDWQAQRASRPHRLTSVCLPKENTCLNPYVLFKVKAGHLGTDIQGHEGTQVMPFQLLNCSLHPRAGVCFECSCLCASHCVGTWPAPFQPPETLGFFLLSPVFLATTPRRTGVELGDV